MVLFAEMNNDEEKKRDKVEKGATIPTSPDQLPEDIGGLINNGEQENNNG